MRITISTTGEIYMETNGSTPAEIAGTVLSIQRELRRQQEEAQKRQAPVSLGTVMAETWNWLVDNDNPKGIHLQAVAQYFGIKKEAAGQRLQQLVAEGHAERVSVGRYRATDGTK